MIACGIQKLSPAQQKKLEKGLPVRVKAGSAHQVPLTPAQAKKLAKAKANNTGMVLSISGGSLFSDAKDWYVNNIPPKYREPIERLVVAGAEDAGIPGTGVRRRGLSGKKKKGKGILEDMMRPPSIQQLVDFQNQLKVPSIQQAVDLQNQLAMYNPIKPIRGKGRGKGFMGFPDANELSNFPSSLVQGFRQVPAVLKKAENILDRDLMKPLKYVGEHLRTGEPMRLEDGRAPLSLQQWQKGDPFAMRASGMQKLAVMPPSYRRPMSGKGKKLVQKTLRGKGWKEDLEAFNAWTGSIGDKLVNIGRTVDPEGKLQKAGINAIVDYIAPEAKAARIASDAAGQFSSMLNKKDSDYQGAANMAMNMLSGPAEEAPKREQGSQGPRSKKGKKKKPRSKIPVVSATVVDEAPTAVARPVTMPDLPPIPASYKYLDEDEGRAYQPVRWMGTGAKKSKAVKPQPSARGAKSPHMVKGSQAARDHMAKLRAMRMAKKGGALYPAGY